MNITAHDKRHINRLLAQEKRVNWIFNQFVFSVSPEMRKWKLVNKNSVWIRNSAIESKINKSLQILQNDLFSVIKEGQKDAWNAAIEKNDLIVENYIKDLSLSSVVKDGMFSRNFEAFTAFQKRVDDGLDLSQRVWKITEQTKGHVELFLESGIADGRSAESIGRDFRQLLNNPDKRFRRIRNEEGKLIASQPMKDYHPGQGVYRSARMNALRVAITETNMGYRLSDAERWQQLDFVLGYEVRRSQNHHPCAICDSLKGKYPKNFVFPGWHPFCICYAVPIVMEHNDFADYLLHDTIPKDQIITDIPQSSSSWISGYMEKSSSQPLFVKQNKSWLNDHSTKK